MAASLTRGRLSRMLPLLSMTSPMLTGTSSRLKTESFCSTLSSKTRKFSGLRPSANRWRSSTTVVCKTTKLTSTLMLEPCLPELASWPGGGGGAGLETGSWAKAGPAKTVAAQTRQTKRERARMKKLRRWKNSVAGGVIASLGIDAERRKPLGRAQLDLELAPASVVSLVAWSIAEDILISQLHADF